eukprot:UN12915
MTNQTQSSKLAKNVSAVVFTRPLQVLVTRIGTSNWQKYPSMIPHRGFHFANTKPMKTFNMRKQTNNTHYKNNYVKQWKVQSYDKYSFQMRLALGGYYHV